MSNKSALIRQVQVQRPLPRLPHPSWRQALPGAERERQAVSADDFWNRLGI